MGGLEGGGEDGRGCRTRAEEGGGVGGGGEEGKEGGGLQMGMAGKEMRARSVWGG